MLIGTAPPLTLLAALRPAPLLPPVFTCSSLPYMRRPLSCVDTRLTCTAFNPQAVAKAVSQGADATAVAQALSEATSTPEVSNTRLGRGAWNCNGESQRSRCPANHLPNRPTLSRPTVSVGHQRYGQICLSSPLYDRAPCSVTVAAMDTAGPLQ